MGSWNSPPGLSANDVGGWSDLPKAEVLRALDKIVEGPQFRSSKKCTRFLRHVVEAALDRRLDCLKERTLGVDVFDREPHYDTNQDPIVRGTAGEVRKRLAQYYLESGAEDEYRVSLPAGSYVPEIHKSPLVQAAKAIVLAPTTQEPQVLSPLKTSRSRILPLSAAVAALSLIAAAVVLLWSGRGDPLDRFWAPLLKSDQPPVVCMGQPQLYTFRTDTANALNTWFASGPARGNAPPPLSSVPLSEIVPMWQGYVALSDTQAFARVASLFARKGKQVDLRGERSVSLTELRKRPSILIGAFDNNWTLNLAGELRFHFEQDSQTHVQIIRDREKPSQSSWKLIDPWPITTNIHTDYALVTRVVNHTTEQTVVTLAGISQYGTGAAAEFVTNPAYFSRALVNAPKNWERKNLQVVLSTTVMSETSGPPTVVAVYFW
ncbi:MAG: hypothetical protein M3Y57_10230 [Acidobacteriota bacterium]|nr:hypothetical protein [Acidobacteriota bacterium]